MNGRIVSQGVLIVKGVRDDGEREILTVAVADTESEATWQDVFASLKTRGLTGVRLVTSDRHTGIIKAVRKHFQGAGWQRCQVHFSRNACGLVPRKARKELAANLRRCLPLSTGRVRLDSLESQPSAGGLATRKWPSSSRITSNSALRFWPFQLRIGSGCGRPTGWNGLTRRSSAGSA